MQDIITFILTNKYSIIVVIAFIFVCALLIKKGYSNKVKSMLFFLVCKAEMVYGSGTGTLKYAQVTDWLYQRLPKIIQIVFTQKEIDAMIEAAVKDMKAWLSENEKARDYIDEMCNKKEV